MCLIYLSVDSIPYHEQEMYQQQHAENQQAAAMILIARLCRKIKTRKMEEKSKRGENHGDDEGMIDSVGKDNDDVRYKK